MKKLFSCFAVSAVFLFDLIYLAMVADSYRQEYLQDGFVHWGFPQWGWLYQSPEFYHYFTISYMLLIVMALGIGVYFLYKQSFKLMMIMLLFPFVSAVYFAYLPRCNWNKQFEIFNQERDTENSRVPAGKWWVSEKNMQRFGDTSKWERFKGLFARGEWPGGYAIWGDYRIWLIPDVLTDTLGRRGLVIHGGTKDSSPWGIDMGDDVVDFAIHLRENGEPLMLDVTYDLAQSRTDEDEKVSVTTVLENIESEKDENLLE